MGPASADLRCKPNGAREGDPSRCSANPQGEPAKTKGHLPSDARTPVDDPVWRQAGSGLRHFKNGIEAAASGGLGNNGMGPVRS